MINHFDNLHFDEAALQKGVSVSLCTVGNVVYGPVVSFFECFDRTVYGGIFFIRASAEAVVARLARVLFRQSGISFRTVTSSIFNRLAVRRL